MQAPVARLLSIGLMAAGFIALFAGSAAAQVAPTPPTQMLSAHTPVSASYKGWGYVVSPTQTVKAWAWMPDGTWGDGGMLSGETVYVHPFSGTWSWAWSEGSWYALPTRTLARWSCQPANGQRVVVREQVVAHRYNSSITMAYGTVLANTPATLFCSSAFPDAAVVPGVAAVGEAMALVQVRVPCQLPANPEAPACPAGGVDRWAYVKRSALGPASA